jgi:hypothetical protein
MNAWTSKPGHTGHYWHFDGDVMRVLFVLKRPGHDYLAVQDEPNSITGKRSFRMADKIGGQWQHIECPSPPSRMNKEPDHA